MRPSPRVAVVALALLTWIGACTPQRDEAPLPPPGHEAPPTVTPAPAGTLEGSDGSVERAVDPYLWRVRGEVVGTHDGCVYVADGGHVSALDLDCRRDCRPVWRATVDGWPSQIAFHRDHVFVPADEHGIAVFPADCRRCRPELRIRFGVFDRTSTYDNARELPPTLFRLLVVDHRLYVIGELDIGDTSAAQLGRVFAFDAACGSPCRPLWIGPVGNGLLQPPTIHDGSVYVPSSSGLSVFDSSCRSDGGMCSPLWTAPMNTDADFMLMSPPSFAGELVVELTEGYVGGGDADLPQVAAFPVGCRSDGEVCPPVWSNEIRRERFAAGPLIHGGRVYVTTGGWNRRGMTFGFPLECAGRCIASDVYEMPGEFFRGPLLAGGRLVAAGYGRGSVAFFDPDCPADPCRPVDTWRSPARAATIERVGERVLAAAGRDLLLFPVPGEGRWQPRWRWHGERAIEDVEIHGRIALVATHRHVYAVKLPR